MQVAYRPNSQVSWRGAAFLPLCAIVDGLILGSVADTHAQRFTELIANDDFRNAAALISGTVTASNLEVYLQQCRKPDEHDTLFSVQSAKADAAGRLQFTDLLERTLSPQQVSDIRSALQASLQHLNGHLVDSV